MLLVSCMKITQKGESLSFTRTSYKSRNRNVDHRYYRCHHSYMVAQFVLLAYLSMPDVSWYRRHTTQEVTGYSLHTIPFSDKFRPLRVIEDVLNWLSTKIELRYCYLSLIKAPAAFDNVVSYRCKISLVSTVNSIMFCEMNIRSDGRSLITFCVLELPKNHVTHVHIHIILYDVEDRVSSSGVK